MKTFIPINMIVVLLLMSNCNQHHDPSTADIQQLTSQKLQAATWKVKTVLRDGVDVTSDYTSFTLTIASSTYTTTNGSLAWPASGTWAFQTQSTTQVIRDGALPVDFILSTDATSLNLSFTIAASSYTGGRVDGLKGAYEFDLIH